MFYVSDLVPGDVIKDDMSGECHEVKAIIWDLLDFPGDCVIEFDNRKPWHTSPDDVVFCYIKLKRPDEY